MRQFLQSITVQTLMEWWIISHYGRVRSSAHRCSTTKKKKKTLTTIRQTVRGFPTGFDGCERWSHGHVNDWWYRWSPMEIVTNNVEKCRQKSSGHDAFRKGRELTEKIGTKCCARQTCILFLYARLKPDFNFDRQRVICKDVIKFAIDSRAF